MRAMIGTPTGGTNTLAGIEYHGVAGASHDCEDAVKRQLQFGDRIKHARILTCSRKHSLLITNGFGDVIAIKSGFSSGYGGEGPRRFSCSLQLLRCHGAGIDECDVDNAVIERLDSSALTAQDLERINAAKPIWPSRCDDYIMERHFAAGRDGTLWQDCSEGEMAARANLLVSAYGAHRNPRAHRELRSSATEQISEFLLLNHLFRLEQDSQVVDPKQANK
jgi:hypothetical protein